jgi:hypothetical protein
VPTTDNDSLAQLIDDARHMPAAMLPRQKTAESRVIDLTALDVRIPEATRSLVDDYELYGS